MAQFVNIYDVDLMKPSAPRQLRQMVCEGDAKGNRVGANVYSDGIPVSLGGQCVGKVVRADGTTVQLTGTVSGNQAYVVLDQSSCAIEGQIQVAVCWVSGTNITTLVVAYGAVINTQTGTAVQPSTPIPDLTQLLAEIDAMRAATAAANAAAEIVGEDINTSSLWAQGAISPSTGTDYASETIIRSNYLPNNAKVVGVQSGYQYSIRAYTDAPAYEYIGMWNGSEFVKQNESVWLQTNTDLTDIGDYKYRIILSATTGAAISTGEYVRIDLITITDTTLTKNGIPADAGVTGTKIDSLNAAMSAVASDGLIPVSGEPWTYGRYINVAGAISNSAGMWLSGFVPISYGRGSVQVSYTYNSKAPELRFAQYDSNMTYIAGTYQRFNTTVNRVRINLSQTARFILFSIGNWNTRYEIAELTPYFSINFETAVFYLLGGDIIERNADQMATLVAGVDRRSRAYDGTIKKNFALAMITDTHGDSLRTQNAVDLLNGSSLIDGAIHLGDAINSAYNTTEMGKIVTIINKAEKPFLAVMGNHDGRMRANTNCTVEQATAAYMGATSMSANYQARGYGYYDFSDYKIRVVMLNNYDFPDDKNGSDWVYYGASTMYLQAQIDWFLTTLSNTPADYSVIVASHYSEPTTIDQTILNQHVGTVGVAELSDTRGGVGQMGDTIIADIINAFINRTTLTKSYTYDTQGSVSGVSVLADFSARSASNFICYICGHVHCQGIGSITNYPGQLSYFNDTGCIAAGDNPNNMWPTYASLIPRNGEDRTQDLITVLCVDTDNKRVSFVRVGANMNMFGEDSSFIAHTY